MAKGLNSIIDALDIETFIICQSEEQAEKKALQLMKDLGFENGSVVFAQHLGPGARVRVRTYIHRPGDKYGWLFSDKGGEE